MNEIVEFVDIGKRSLFVKEFYKLKEKVEASEFWKMNSEVPLVDGGWSTAEKMPDQCWAFEKNANDTYATVQLEISHMDSSLRNVDLYCVNVDFCISLVFDQSMRLDITNINVSTRGVQKGVRRFSFDNMRALNALIEELTNDE